jgi:hypothetical protein
MGSIQTLKFEPMSEIEKKIGFKQNTLVEERDRDAIGHRSYLRLHGNRRERL